MVVAAGIVEHIQEISQTPGVKEILVIVFAVALTKETGAEERTVLDICSPINPAAGVEPFKPGAAPSV